MKIRSISSAHVGRRGGAMVAALLVVFAVATLSMIQLQLDLSKARERRTAVDTKRAFYMAEAGLAEAFHGIASGKSGNVGTPEDPAQFGNGIFFTTAEEEGLGRVTLTSTGLCGAGRSTLSIVVERTSSSVAALGFFGEESVDVEGGATIDSYDSRSGPYVAPLRTNPPPVGAKVGSNQSLMVGGRKGTTDVYGDAQPGPSGVLVRGKKTTISGSTAPFLTANVLDPIVVPTYPLQTSITTSLLRPIATIPAGERAFDTLRVTALTKLVITGPARIVVGDLVVDSLGELYVDASRGPVEFYVTDELALKSGSKYLSTATDPRSVSLMVSGTRAEVAATGSLHGTIYAPAAALTIPSSFQVYGAASARQLTIAADAKMHFDTSLLEAGANESGLPRMLGWQLVELPNVPVVKLRHDALNELLKQGKRPKKGSKSHFDIGVLPL